MWLKSKVVLGQFRGKWKIKVNGSGSMQAMSLLRYM